MGNRHQAFAIARVVPHGARDGRPKYRCIAAYHNQHCSGEVIVSAVGRFIYLIKQKENAEVIKAEIRNIQGKYGRWKNEPQLPGVPCPFTASMLGIAWDVDFGDENTPPYASGVTFESSVLEADMGPWDCDNDSGISIIDVSDPEDPAYGLVGYNPESPLDVQTYAAHHPVERFACVLNSVRVVTQDMFEEVWPKKDEQDPEREVTDAERLQLTADDLIPSLAEMSFEPALDQAIGSGDVSSIEAVMWHLEKAQKIREYLRRQSPFPPIALSLLEAVLVDETDGSMDLSGYDLSMDQVIQVVASKQGIEAVNLCFNERITAQDLSKLLTAFPLRRLVLIGCTSIEEAALNDLMQKKPGLFYNLEALLHPSLMRVPEPRSCPMAFTFACMAHDYSWPLLSGCSLPVFTPTNIVQSLIDLTDYNIKFPVMDTREKGIVVQTVFTAVRKANRPLGQRSLVAAPSFSILPFYYDSDRPTEWMCIFKKSAPWRDVHPSKYAFVRYNRPSSQAADEHEARGELAIIRPWLQSFDLHGFLDALEGEGRPPVDAKLVTTLSQFLLSDEETQNRTTEAILKAQWEPDNNTITFMTEAQISSFMESVALHAKHG